MKNSDQINPSFNLTLRLRLRNGPGYLNRAISAIRKAGGGVISIDLVAASEATLTRDIVLHTSSETQGRRVIEAVKKLRETRLVNVSDRVFLMHLGGKIEVEAKRPIRTRDDFSLAYTPGVRQVSESIAEKPEKVWALTMKRGMVAIVTDGSAVLDLGNVGPEAALPVMEGKAQLFKAFGGINAFPICLDTQDSAEIVETVVRIAPGFGAINLEDISSPRCFEVQRTLQALLDVPVFHDGQEGTAVVVLAALLNALKVVGKRMRDIKVVISGVGASGVGVARLLLQVGVRNLIGCDRAGAVYEGRRENMNPIKEWFAENTNTGRFKGTLARAVRGADVFIGLSAPGSVKAGDIQRMAKSPIVFALATPRPEVDPEKIPFAKVVATGRPDYPNQINSVLAFPGIFRGCLDVRASRVTEPMLVAAAHAIADVISPKELQPNYVVPAIFNSKLARLVGAAVSAAAHKSGVAHRGGDHDFSRGGRH